MNAVELGKQIRARRKSLGLTIKDLSRQTGLSHPTIGALERAEKASNNSTIIKVLSVLDLSTEAEKPARPEWAKEINLESEIVKHLEQILAIATVENVSISVGGTESGVVYTKTYRK